MSPRLIRVTDFVHLLRCASYHEREKVKNDAAYPDSKSSADPPPD